MKKHTLFYLILLGLCSVIRLSALPSTITMGTEDAWMDLSSVSGIRFVPGQNGYADISLKDGEYAPNDATDLLLHFNSMGDGGYSVGGKGDGGYVVDGDYPEITAKIKRLGEGSGVFQKNGDYLKLQPLPGSLFAPGGSWGDFTIEFWLYPATLDEGDTIFLWKGSRRLRDRIISQEVRCSINSGALQWSFKNVFLPPDRSEKTITVSGRIGLIPRSWHHHMLRFESGTALVEYLIDGIPDSITHATESGRESGQSFSPVTGDAISGNIEIGSSLNGLLDEMRISRTFVTEPGLTTFAQSTGTAVTRVLDLGYSNTRLLQVEAGFSTPRNTGIHFYYRLGESFRSSSEVVGDWVPFNPEDKFPPNTKGRYLQLLMELYPDGSGDISPTVSTIRVVFDPDFPPHPPAWIRVEPQNASLSVTWQASTDNDVAGYLVFYGDKPNQYFSSESNAGQSPVDAGTSTQITLTGLTNGQLYYVAVVAYDSSTPSHRSDFSKESAARPSSIHQQE